MKNTETLHVATIGNPNCGKTTLFNGLTGSNQHIGNWPGVTVEKITGRLIGTKDIEVVDLPGIYSLNATSEDELVAREYLLSGHTEVIVNIVDASNLERNLFLTLTLLEMNKPIIVLLTMTDIAERSGVEINTAELSRILGVPVLGINALNEKDVKKARDLIIETARKQYSPSENIVKYPDFIENILRDFSEKLFPLTKNMQEARFYSVMLLEEDPEITEKVTESGLIPENEIRKALETIKEKSGETADIVIASARFEAITAITERTVRKKSKGKIITEKIDRIVLNKWLGVPLFLLAIYILFWFVTKIGGSFIDFFDILFSAIFIDGTSVILNSLNAPDWLIVILANGVGGGIKTVATFIPIISSMFFMLSILEDSGYMARASYVMDHFMRRIGLPGKAFVPMLVGFGCTVPAVMATRTLENKKDRYLTVFMAPFMSCGARLPVYALFGAAFFGKNAGLVIVSLYVVGIIMAVATGFLLKNTLFKGEAAHFAMELPPYHPPHLKQILLRTWNRLKVFILKAGQIIVIAVLVLSFLNSVGTNGKMISEDNSQQTILASIGKAITPVLTPMGIDKDNWPATVGLMTGIFAKEAIVGTMNSLYGQIAASKETESQEKISNKSFSLTKSVKEAFISIPQSLSRNILPHKVYAVTQNPDKNNKTFAAMRKSFADDWARAYAYLLFVLIYFPCVAAMSAIIREIGTKFGFLAVTYLTILAWSVSTLFFQIIRGHNFFYMIIAVGLVVLFIPVFNLVSGRRHGYYD